MHRQIGLFLALALGLGATAMGQQAQPDSSSQGTRSVSHDATSLVEQGNYVNRDGAIVHRPAHTVSGAAPAGASAQCRDGSYSFSLHHSGTCSHHGGVARWLK
ncbi:MAG TPA: DUF3761 domain-containing protein [Dyella sp.]|uniref:DUF3761 domain-containing protein n=1 Tax=Dyella sp. TaxID=1869338 RepID=UPI002BB25622|nr:DUF3761 domain-containing protein [Dyella sp.]HTV85450.1 DUF3761 domain-containing protein [Dyella sp.]